MALMYNNESLMLLVFLEAALFVISLFIVIYRKATIKGGIEVPIGISETNKDNIVKIVVRNESPVTVARMKVLLVVKNTITGKQRKSWMKLAGTHNEETAFVQNIVFDKPGNYEIVLKKLRIYDITGLLYGDKKINGSTRIVVMPRIHDIVVKLSNTVKSFYGESDEYDEHKPGHDNSEIYDIREYRAGDRVQNVHWKMTAKQDELMVKEHSMPKACPVVLCLSSNKKRQSIKNEKNMHFTEVAASISFSMMDAGCPHYVAWYDDYKRDIVRIRVDDEESMFLFMGKLMDVKWAKQEEDIAVLYKEKYKSENYVWILSLDDRLVLKRGEEVMTQISHRRLEQSLAQVELIL